jgi:hypothetical protein
MTVQEFEELKRKLKVELARRNCNGQDYGRGSVAEYAGSTYDISQMPTVGMKTKPEHGKKTVDLFLQIEDFGDLRLVKENDPIPKSFGKDMIAEIDRLATEQYTGESEDTHNKLHPNIPVEKSSCRGMCTGLCVGNCIGLCNGCTDTCTVACTGCTGCNNSCTGSCSLGCQGGCNSCTGCASGCQGCYSACTGCKSSVK